MSKRIDWKKVESMRQEGYSQEATASILKINKNSISRYYKGKWKPPQNAKPKKDEDRTKNIKFPCLCIWNEELGRGEYVEDPLTPLQRRIKGFEDNLKYLESLDQDISIADLKRRIRYYKSLTEEEYNEMQAHIFDDDWWESRGL